ncbi:cytochrome c biogenesis CcdA family protein [Luteithermobacter gelatinilyticus]|uniref:cytochrome c biogenesis CcdA family protein n=1 Tax=Luteithermobacter gelatinilyticus TaxID=2582913 RepID=UPI001106ACA2|nr:cytochrome c biogenesis protein CcdA [Luteithermobacter gelatinilyticus]|tara:strand:- start:7613 stop:8347 length:735 start_codon:yes stop_codon:yes gene_type:complete
METTDISYFAALLGGIFSFLSPCVLPLVPAYVCFVTGNSLNDLREGDKVPLLSVFWGALAFVLGFSTVFVALGAGASSLQPLLLNYMPVFSKVAGALIMILGIHFTGLVRIPLLYREARFQTRDNPAGILGAYVVGLAFAFGWTPCIGPILGTILTLAASQQTFGAGVSLLGVYSLGLGVPFVVAALSINRFLSFSGRFRRHLRTVEILIGLLLIMTGLAIFTGLLQTFGNVLLDWFPGLAKIG